MSIIRTALKNSETGCLLAVAMAAGIGMPAMSRLFPEPRPARIFTHADEERQLKAQEKRERKASKRRARGGNV